MSLKTPRSHLSLLSFESWFYIYLFKWEIQQSYSGSSLNMKHFKLTFDEQKQVKKIELQFQNWTKKNGRNDNM